LRNEALEGCGNVGHAKAWPSKPDNSVKRSVAEW
jgi:hypothetical protein